MHCWVFVDDYLLAGDTEELTAEACVLFETLLAELDVEWAPHKKRGPARAMIFLGLLLCNVEGMRCIGLPEEREAEMQVELQRWLDEERKQETHELREVARLLGRLVFCSQVVEHGRTYMQGMLSAFAGCEVDWRKGVVKFKDENWQRLQLHPNFWRDVEWFADHLRNRNCRPMLAEPLGQATISGSDASDWGCGAVCWLDGQREESRMRFTHAEQRRPINWRELLGIVRILEFWGHRLRGSHLLIESDSLVCVCVLSALASRAADMQELVRSLVELLEYWQITFRACHTPGKLLNRPDQVSRGEAVEEPRVRLRRNEFKILEQRFGPFDEFLGAERQWARPKGAKEVGSIWMHPAHATVGSALRLLCDRVEVQGAGVKRAMVIVPDAPSARWAPLLKHFTVVGRWEAGSENLEVVGMCKWKLTTSRRASLLLAFPRAAGVLPRAVRWPGERAAAGAEYVTSTDGGWPHLSIHGQGIYGPQGKPPLTFSSLSSTSRIECRVLGSTQVPCPHSTERSASL